MTIESYADCWAQAGRVSNETGVGWVQVGYLADALTGPLECKTTAIGVPTIDWVEWAQTENGWIMNEFLEEEK